MRFSNLNDNSTEVNCVSMRAKLLLHRSTVLNVLCGVLIGFSLSYFYFFSIDPDSKWSQEYKLGDPTLKNSLPGFKWSLDDIPSYLKQLPLSPDEGPNIPVPMHEEHGGNDLAEKLAENIRVLCWIMTQPKNHKSKAKHVKATWGRRCTYLLFMSSEADYSLPAIRLKVSEGRNALWDKTKESFKYVYQHYMDKVDWVLKADDDTYVVLENLRYVLSQHNASEKSYMGCHFKPYVKQGYMSGGAGYVLSRAAVKAFVEEAIPNKKCRQDGGGAEDVEIGKCLELVNVKTVDSRDQFGRHRFFPLPPTYHLVPRTLPDDSWLWKYIYYPMKSGFDCCSDTMISFHYISPNEMYTLEFFIYHVQPYGIRHALTGDSTEPYFLHEKSAPAPTVAPSPTLGNADIKDNEITNKER